MLRELRLIASDEDEARRLVIARASQQSIISGLVANAVCRHDTDLEAKDGDLRLTDGNSTSGRLEVFFHMEWVTVCAGEWMRESTRVACRQLGFPDGVSWYVQDEHTLSVSRRRVGLSTVACDGNETRLVDCRHDEWFTHQSQSQQHKIRCPANHSRDVFLRCLCPQCSDYVPSETLQLADGNSMSGRVEVRSADRGWSWTSICDQHWTDANTRVVCRQLKFADGAGTYEYELNSSRVDGSSSTVGSSSRTPAMAAYNVSCVGNETSLFQCQYTPSVAAVHCEQPVYVRCLCTACTHRFLLQTPGYQEAESNSNTVLRWTFNNNITEDAIEVWLESRKNRQLLAKMVDGQQTTVRRGTGAEFYFRFQLVVGDDGRSVELRIANVTSSDLGIYSISLPRRQFFDSRAVLFVTDFAFVPRGQLRCKVGDNMTVTWDLTTLRHLQDVGVQYNMYVTTPASGRLQLDYYYNHWLVDNRRLSAESNRFVDDPLMVNTVIEDVRPGDAGTYELELQLFTRSTFYSVNYAYTFNTTLTVEGINIDESSHHNNPYFLATICLVVLLLVAVLSTVGYCYKSSRRSKAKATRKGSTSSQYDTESRKFYSRSRRRRNQEDDGVQVTVIGSTEHSPSMRYQQQSQELEDRDAEYNETNDNEEDVTYGNEDIMSASEPAATISVARTSVDRVESQQAVNPPDHIWQHASKCKRKTIFKLHRSPMPLPVPSNDDV